MKFAHFAQPYKRPDESVRERHQLLCRELALCDEIGFDFAFCAEQHFTQIMPSPVLYSSYLAAHTRRLRGGVMGYVVPFHEPLRLYEEVALLDNVLGGRLELGMVPGIIPNHFKIFKADWENRRSLTNEAVHLIKKAAASNAHTFSFEGEHHSYQDIKFTVAPLQRPHPPIWLMSRTPKELEFLAREGIHTGSLLFGPRKEVDSRYREYLRLWKDAGHQHIPNICYVTFGYVDETDELARTKAAPHIVHSLNAIYSFGSKTALADTYVKRGEYGAAEIARNMNNPQYYYDNNLVFVGSPQSVIQQIRSAATEGCFNTIFFEFNIGTLPEEDLMRSIRLFGTQVIPALRDFQPAQFQA